MLNEQQILEMRSLKNFLHSDSFKSLCLFGAIPYTRSLEYIEQGCLFHRHAERLSLINFTPLSVIRELLSKDEALEGINEALNFLGFQEFAGFQFKFGEDTLCDVIQDYFKELGEANNMPHVFPLSSKMSDEDKIEIATWFIFDAWNTEKYPEGFSGFLCTKPNIFKGSNIVELKIDSKEYERVDESLLDNSSFGYWEAREVIKRRMMWNL